MLQHNKTTLNSSNRSWSFTRGKKITMVDDILWFFTIADVRLENPEDYNADVLLWANHVLTDSEALIRKTGI